MHLSHKENDCLNDHFRSNFEHKIDFESVFRIGVLFTI